MGMKKTKKDYYHSSRMIIELRIVCLIHFVIDSMGSLTSRHLFAIL